MKTTATATGARQVIAYLVIYIGAILLFCLLTIVPGRSELAELDQQYKETLQRIEDQKVLVPFFRQLVGKINFKPPKGLPLAKPAALPRADTVQLRQRFTELAEKSGVAIVRFAPDFTKTAGQTNLLFIHLVLSGKLSDFRTFYLKVGGLPYIRHIEQVRVRTVKDRRETEMKIWLSLK
jgi:hypothetical protein